MNPDRTVPPRDSLSPCTTSVHSRHPPPPAVPECRTRHLRASHSPLRQQLLALSSTGEASGSDTVTSVETSVPRLEAISLPRSCPGPVPLQSCPFYTSRGDSVSFQRTQSVSRSLCPPHRAVPGRQASRRPDTDPDRHRSESLCDVLMTPHSRTFD